MDGEPLCCTIYYLSGLKFSTLSFEICCSFVLECTRSFSIHSIHFARGSGRGSLILHRRECLAVDLGRLRC
jgi:hypothetical protein